MSPEVEAAIIAGCVGVLTLIGTLAAQFYGIHRTTRDTRETLREQGGQLDRTLAEQREQLDRTLAEQREQLDRTLAEQREQLDRTLAEQRTRTLNERFAVAADKLGSDKPPAVRLAGVYAMAGLADDWPENRHSCVDVLCAYLRLPYEADPGDDATAKERLGFRASREVRHTVIRIITAHLQEDARVPWRGLDFDFTGTVFDGGYFGLADFSGSTVTFDEAEFSGNVNFAGSKFSGPEVSFFRTKFSDGFVSFGGVDFSDDVNFTDARFLGSIVNLSAAFSGDEVSFAGAEFSSGGVYFSSANFSGEKVFFNNAVFSGGEVSFSGAVFSSGEVSFIGAQFVGADVNFGAGDHFSLSVGAAEFRHGTINFTDAADWSHPPTFAWDGAPPAGVKLPPGLASMSST
jgi:uncharacterized protein YjbI with pentapeptide repeats